MIREFKNRKAFHDYYFLEELESGIVLTGTEIKSIRAGKVSFKDSYARIENGEVWLYNLHISPYDKGNVFNHEPERKRKLLLKRKEIQKLSKKVEEKGMTLIPKKIFINNRGLAKIILAVAKGKKLYDKREILRRKDEERDWERRKKDGLK